MCKRFEIKSSERLFALVLNYFIRELFILFFVCLSFLFLFFSIFVLKKSKQGLFLSKINHIVYSFKYTYKNSLHCLKERCLIDCLLKKYKQKRTSPYTSNDIPGPFPYNYPNIDVRKDICKNNTFLFISIITSCNELEERMAVRKVYEKIDKSIELHFFIGYTTKECNKQYIYERNLFHDISQMPIQESFANETLFTLYLYKILPIICPNAEYYGKMDADQYINFNKLTIVLYKSKGRKNIFYACKSWRLYSVNTNQSYKYSSSLESGNYYNKVIPKNGINSFTGCFALWSNYISHLIYDESIHESHLIRMDDQHISWIIYRLNKKNMNISLCNLKCLHAIKEKNLSCFYPLRSGFGVHQIKGKYLYAFYKLIKTNNQ